MPDEQKAAISRGKIGKKRTPEQCAYFSLIRKGKRKNLGQKRIAEKLVEEIAKMAWKFLMILPECKLMNGPFCHWLPTFAQRRNVARHIFIGNVVL